MLKKRDYYQIFSGLLFGFLAVSLVSYAYFAGKEKGKSITQSKVEKPTQTPRSKVEIIDMPRISVDIQDENEKIDSRIIDAIVDPLTPELLDGIVKGSPSALLYVMSVVEFAYRLQGNVFSWNSIGDYGFLTSLNIQIYNEILKRKPAILKSSSLVRLCEFIYYAAAKFPTDPQNSDVLTVEPPNIMLKFLQKQFARSMECDFARCMAAWWLMRTDHQVPEAWDVSCPFSHMALEYGRSEIPTPDPGKYGLIFPTATPEPDEEVPTPQPTASTDQPDQEQSQDSTPTSTPSSKPKAPSFLGT